MQNKKKFGFLVTLLALVCAASVIFGACNVKNTEPVTYTISFAGGAGATGTAPAAIVGEEGDTVTLPANTFVKDGYAFDKWSDGSAEYAAGAAYTVPARNITLTATWSEVTTPPEQVTVTVKNGAETVDTQTLDKGAKYTLPAALTAEGKRFEGWQVGAEVKEAGAEITVTETVEITAKWVDLVTVTVKNGAETVDTQTLDKGAKYTLPAALTAEGKRFEGWQVGAEVKEAGAEITVTETVEITAKWTNVYTVTFEKGYYAATGDAPASMEKAAGETVVLPENPFTYLHNTFAGWQPYIGGVKDGEVLVTGESYTMTAAATTFKATWAANNVTVKFEGGEGATGTMEDQTVLFGKPLMEPECKFTNGDKTFAGWLFNGEFKTFPITMNASTVPVDDVVTLTATWMESLTDLVGVYETADGVKMLIADDGTMIFDGKLLLTMDNSMGYWGGYDSDYTIEYAVGALSDGKRFVSSYDEKIGDFVTYEFTRTGDVVNSTEAVTGGYLRTQGTVVDVPLKLNADGSGVWMLNATKYEVSAISYELLGDYVIVRNGSYFYLMSRTADGLAGWYNNGAVQPVFKKATVHTLTMTANGITKTQLAADGAKAVVWTPTVPEGQTFDQWVVKGTETVFTFDTALTADLEIEAVFAKPVVTYTVKMASGNFKATGTATAMDAAEAGEEIVLPENPFTLTHYSFAGWQPCTYTTEVDSENNPHEVDTPYGAKLGVGETFTMIGQPVKFKATWTVNMVTIKFDGGAGATGSMADVSKKFETSYFVPECGFVNGNKTFLGWSLNGIDLIDSAFPLNDKNVPANDIVTLHAVWQQNIYVPTIEELAGAWTGAGGTLSVDKTQSAGVLNGKYNLTLQLIEGVWYAFNDDASLEYVVSLSGSVLTLTSYDSTKLEFSAKAELINKAESVFYGRFARKVSDVTTQPLMLVEGGKGYLNNSAEVSYTVIGDYVVVRQYVSTSGSVDYFNYYVLTRVEDVLSGWLLQNEKAPAAVTFTESADVFVLTADGKFNQMVMNGKQPLADKLVAPTAPDGQKFDKWVLSGTQTEFDATAAVTADVSIEAVFSATAAAKVFEGNYTFNAVLKKALVRVSINEDTDTVEYVSAKSGVENPPFVVTAVYENGAYKAKFEDAGETWYLKISDDGQTLNIYDYASMDKEDLLATFTLAA